MGRLAGSAIPDMNSNQQVVIVTGGGKSSVVAASALKHIAVCICTYKRPELLRRLLTDLGSQQTDDLFTYSIVVADNDAMRSAEPIVSEFAGGALVGVKYCVEPAQNIALARNKAVENTAGDFIAFIDDDEFPAKDWLLTLFNTCNEHGVAGVLGPVLPYFEKETPKWVVKGKFYERATYSTGYVIDWRKGRTGNVLLKKELFTGLEQPFRPEFRAGEDQDFFRRMIDAGHVFIWCSEAVAYEVVPPSRWKRSFMLRRALLRGAIEPKNPTFGIKSLGKSVVAIVVYAVALPFALLFGHHRFMILLVRLFDHLGKILAFLGINPVRTPYVTE